ncbi:MAG: biotin--[acetyl-CoA-carboxylase] ligase [Bacteroidetes bacterium]|nr:MAG: biotin--[acetyl-CoA-carboxylase] ligase [Bacteroidota bacterium]
MYIWAVLPVFFQNSGYEQKRIPGIKVRNFLCAGNACLSGVVIYNELITMANTLFVGKVYLHFDELPSTNDHARILLAKSKPAEGMVIRADSQSAGRGQYGSPWLSQPGKNLLLSVILYPLWLPVPKVFLLSKAVALAVYDTVSAFSGSPSGTRIKWPNDILLDGRKVAGILIQNTFSNSNIQAAIVGIGLNVNQNTFPPELPQAGSLAMACGHEINLETVADLLYERLEKRYLQLKNGAIQALEAEYATQLAGMGETRTFTDQAGNTFQGRITEVENDGHLIVETGQGKKRFAVKEVHQH